MIQALKIYQRYISPLIGPRCRFYPSCSQYALLALERHKTLVALWYVARRLLRCNPLHPGGVDYPPYYYNNKTAELSSQD